MGWDVEDERLRLLSLEPYMDEIEENKKNLKRYWGSSASAQQEKLENQGKKEINFYK